MSEPAPLPVQTVRVGLVIDVTDEAVARRAAKRRWAALAVLSLVQLVLMLDATVVNIALPSIQEDFDLTDARLAWVVNGYLLAFGGLLLLGGRLADLYGRRRVFMAGIALFSGASLMAGLAGNAELVVGMRFVQGVGAALAAPASLSLLSRIFTDPSERARALGVWGGVSAFGAMLGAVLSGVLTEYLSWRWVFLVTVPVTLAALVLARRVVPESTAPKDPHLDVVGAVLVTLAIGTAAFALLDKGGASWNDGVLLARLALACVLLLLFVVREAYAAHPLVPLSIFEHRNRAVGIAAAVVLGAVLTTYYFANTIYLQRVLGYGALDTAVAYLPFGAAILVAFPVVTSVVARVGLRPVMPTGLALVTAGLLLLVDLPTDGTYATDVLPAMLLLGVGAACGFATFTVAGVDGTTDENAGIASGVLNAGSQVGNALGLAALVAIAESVKAAEVADGAPLAQAAITGFTATYTVAAAVVLAMAVAAGALLRSPGTPSPAAARVGGRSRVTATAAATRSHG